MNYEVLLVEKKEIATITLNRPHRRNALNAQLMQELVAALQELDVDPVVKVIIIKGQGNTFCAGADMEELIQGESIMDKRRQKENVANMIEIIGRIGKLVIAQVDGYALAGGCGLAISCDMVVASETAVFGLPEIQRALFPMTIMAPISRCMGRKKAIEFFFVGENMSGKEAEKLGLVNYAVPADRLEQTTLELAQKIADKSPAAVELGKDAFYAMQDMEYFTSLRYLKDILLIDTLTDDAQEGIRAFFEKRKISKWTGK